MNLLERLASDITSVTRHELAREMTRLFHSEDVSGVFLLYDAYFCGAGKAKLNFPMDARLKTDCEMHYAAGLADRVMIFGEEPGQDTIEQRYDGLIVRFYRQSITQKTRRNA